MFHRKIVFVVMLLAIVCHAQADSPQAPLAVTQLLQATLGTESQIVLVAAHRGGYADDRGDDAPENSLANVEIAIDKGFEVYETDIRRTSDGVFVVVHDDTLDRETTGSGPVEKVTIDELKRLRKRFRDGTVSKHRVATFEELLIACKDRILLKPDLKPGVIDHFDQLAQLIKRCDMKKQVFLRTTWKNADAIEKCFATGTPKVEVMFKLGFLNQIKLAHERFHPRTVQINVEKGEQLSPAKKAMIELARDSGMVVQTHLYSDQDQWDQLFAAGVRMFHTSDPDRVLKHFAAIE